MEDNSLVVPTNRGLYCPPGDFYVDPRGPVARAVVTHAHTDHYTGGCGVYLVAQPGETIFRKRLGTSAPIKPLNYGEVLTRNGVQISLHPAGHLLGSAQVRLEYQGQVVVVSGDYKIEPDRTCAPFELVRCHHFITEATFGLPIYHWPPSSLVFDQINAWWKANAADGKATLIYAYALGKAQRVLGNVDPTIGPIYVHGEVETFNEAYRAAGLDLPPTTYATTTEKHDFRGALIVAPPSARGTPWTQRFGNQASAFVSGWMRIRGVRRQRAVDRGFTLSDHVDWDGLLQTIQATGAERIGVTHGYVSVVVRWLREQGKDCYGIEAGYPATTGASEGESG